MASKLIAPNILPIKSAVRFKLFISFLWYARLLIPLATAQPPLNKENLACAKPYSDSDTSVY